MDSMILNGFRSVPETFELRAIPDKELDDYLRYEHFKYVNSYKDYEIEFSYSKSVEDYRVIWKFKPVPDKTGNFGYVTVQNDFPNDRIYTFEKSNFCWLRVQGPHGEEIADWHFPGIYGWHIERVGFLLDGVEQEGIICLQKDLTYNPDKKSIYVHTAYGIQKIHKRQFIKPKVRFFG